MKDRCIDRGGACPINLSGGLSGPWHPMGAAGARMLRDVARRVTGQILQGSSFLPLFSAMNGLQALARTGLADFHTMLSWPSFRISPTNALR